MCMCDVRGSSGKQDAFYSGSKTTSLKRQREVAFQKRANSTRTALMPLLTVNHILTLGMICSLKCLAYFLTSERRHSFLKNFCPPPIQALEGWWGGTVRVLSQIYLCQMIRTSDLMKEIGKDSFLYLHFTFIQFRGAECQHIHLQRDKYFTGVYKRHFVKNVFYIQDQARWGSAFLLLQNQYQFLKRKSPYINIYVYMSAKSN